MLAYDARDEPPRDEYCDPSKVELLRRPRFGGACGDFVSSLQSAKISSTDGMDDESIVVCLDSPRLGGLREELLPLSSFDPYLYTPRRGGALGDENGAEELASSLSANISSTVGIDAASIVELRDRPERRGEEGGRRRTLLLPLDLVDDADLSDEFLYIPRRDGGSCELEEEPLLLLDLDDEQEASSSSSLSPA